LLKLPKLWARAIAGWLRAVIVRESCESVSRLRILLGAAWTLLTVAELIGATTGISYSSISRQISQLSKRLRWNRGEAFASE